MVRIKSCTRLHTIFIYITLPLFFINYLQSRAIMLFKRKGTFVTMNPHNPRTLTYWFAWTQQKRHPWIHKNIQAWSASRSQIKDEKNFRSLGNTSASQMRTVASSPALMIVLLSGPHITLFILPWGPVIVKMSSLDSALQNQISQCQYIQHDKNEYNLYNLYLYNLYNHHHLRLVLKSWYQ